ncbi:MarR family transcriptional regulator [Amycolatopsis sp. PS_44_ISF1]|uniref:MarR family winged helix-turn-helix transcriptional regulator n=1 Tax=Amycolatopsis sp. PS_44_ISF1 TaxID=2974917 RepID=UPI0028DF089A|nr:MarR family transcriptional regulator [Amycolatopsis sp. PS_44_ISF1]MDT8915513.1 MarR family transcriptional regulator [Amycolatopsis sp. PS_44_ISF1]
MSQDGPGRADAQVIAGAIGALVLRANRMHLYDELLGGHGGDGGVAGVDRATYPVISGLARIGPCTTSELADQIGLDRTVASRHATRLQQAGLLARQPSPDDLRSTVLRLTPEGERCVQALRTRLEDLVLAALPDWPPERTHRFAHDLGQVVHNLTGVAAEPGHDHP